jgi:hypothetical protein
MAVEICAKSASVDAITDLDDDIFGAGAVRNGYRVVGKTRRLILADLEDSRRASRLFRRKLERMLWPPA